MTPLKTLMVVVLMAMFCVSCAGAPRIPFQTIVAEADSRIGETVELGGYIMDSRIIIDKTDIIFLQTPLNWNKKPLTRNYSEGRFFVSYQGKFYLNEYDRNKDRFTVTGKIAGTTAENPDLCPSPCLKIESSKIRAWRDIEYYPPMIPNY